MSKTIWRAIQAAPEYEVIPIGEDRMENTKRAFAFYRDFNLLTVDFSMSMDSKLTLDFMGFMWYVGRNYERFGKALMGAAGLMETTSGLEIRPWADPDKAKQYNVWVIAAVNFKIITDDVERFVKWRVKENGLQKD